MGLFPFFYDLIIPRGYPKTSMILPTRAKTPAIIRTFSRIQSTIFMGFSPYTTIMRAGRGGFRLTGLF
jgi:hypothetical protein